MLAARIEQLAAWGLPPHQIRSLVGCSPRLPLCIHAPLFDSGGVLSARHIASRTHAFRFCNTVGFPQFSAGLSFRTTTTCFSELNNAAYTLATPGFIHTLTGYAHRFATGSVANLLWWDLSLSSLTHWVTSVNFMTSRSIPRL